MRFILLATLLLPLSAQAEVFSNSYVSFELPARWKCEIEKTEWFCRSDVTRYSKEAVIILTAKEVGPGDSLSQYEAYLKTPKIISAPDGTPIHSKVRQVKTIQINGHQWVDGMHLASEVPFYYTRYLATVKQRIAILVTFSAHQRFYTKYSNDFFKAIQSLKVIATPNLLNVTTGLSGGAGQIGSPVGIPSDVAEFPIEPSGSSSSRQNMILLAIIFIAVGAYFFLKKKKKNSSQGPLGQ